MPVQEIALKAPSAFEIGRHVPADAVAKTDLTLDRGADVVELVGPVFLVRGTAIAAGTLRQSVGFRAILLYNSNEETLRRPHTFGHPEFLAN
jgi:hypothetical protein